MKISTIIVRNKQRVVPIDTVALHDDAECILAKLEYEEYELSVLLVSDTKMRHYNREFRKVDRVTDILSFPYYPDLKAGERLKPASEEEKIVGDILIAPQYVLSTSQANGVPFERRMRELLVHGIFHLLGYDHGTDEEFELMSAQEREMLTYLEVQRPAIRLQ